MISFSFSVNLPIELKDIKFVKGTPKIYVRPADSGHVVARNFCGTCRSPVLSDIKVEGNMTMYVKPSKGKRHCADRLALERPLVPPGVCCSFFIH